MKLGLKDVGIYENDVHSLDDLVNILKTLVANLGAEPIKIPKTFYGSLHELVSDGLIYPPKLDDKGKFLPTQKGQLLRARNGEVAYLYIPDFINAYKTQENRNKVHMYWCRTLTDMWNDGREDRYWGTTDAEAHFGLENGARVKLNVCRNCYQLIGDNQYKYGDIRNFNFVRFSNDNDNRSKTTYAVSNDSTGYCWVCHKCGQKITDADEVHIKSGNVFCDACYGIEQNFELLKEVKDSSDLEKWFQQVKNIEICDASGITPLLYLLKHNPNVSVIEAMVREYGANVFATDNSGKNAIMYAVDKPTIESNMNNEYLTLKPVIDLLIKLGVSAKSTDKRSRSALGYTKNQQIKDYLLDLFERAGGHRRGH